MLELKTTMQNVKVKNVNTRPEKHGKGISERKIATDINIEAEIGIDELKMFSIGDEADYKTLLFDEDEQVKNIGLAQLDFERTFENHTVTITYGLTDDTIDLIDCKIHKFSAKPIYGCRVILSCQIQTIPPDDMGWDVVQLMRREEIMMKFDPQQMGLFDEDWAEEETGEAEEVDA